MEENAREFSKLSYFEEKSYKKNVSPVQVGFTESETSHFLKDRTETLKQKKPRKCYIQISRSGMFKTHVDLFRFDFDDSADHKIKTSGFANRQYGLHDLEFLTHDNRLNFALYDLNKLNGIAEVGFDKVKFFNGDVYWFDNSERSFDASLGTLEQHGAKREKVKRSCYWKRFFSESLINNFDDEFYEKNIKHTMTQDSLKKNSKSKIVFSDQSK